MIFLNNYGYVKLWIPNGLIFPSAGIPPGRVCYKGASHLVTTTYLKRTDHTFVHAVSIAAIVYDIGRTQAGMRRTNKN